eukprot:750989-Hanusia_phi.AAC.5
MEGSDRIACFGLQGPLAASYSPDPVERERADLGSQRRDDAQTGRSDSLPVDAQGDQVLGLTMNETKLYLHEKPQLSRWGHGQFVYNSSQVDALLKMLPPRVCTHAVEWSMTKRQVCLALVFSALTSPMSHRNFCRPLSSAWTGSTARSSAGSRGEGRTRYEG